MNGKVGETGRRAKLRSIADVYLNRRMAAVFALGLCSGLPNALVFGTLSVWLREAGMSRSAIGALGLVGTAYAFNFVWAPFLDRVSLPGLSRRYGFRRSWGTLLCLALATCIACVGLTDPAANGLVFIGLILLIAFLSASLDVVVDASRIEYLEPQEYAAGSAVATYGWMTGASVIGGFMTLQVSSLTGWGTAYAIAALAMLAGPLAYLLVGEPAGRERGEAAYAQENDPFGDAPEGHGFAAHFSKAVIAPFRDFARRDGWILILAFIILFKAGDAMLGRMANVFYVDMGFTRGEIADVSKLFGLVSFLIGGGVGGALALRIGTLKALFFGGIAMAATNAAYAVLAHSGHDMTVFATAVAADNFTSGLATTTFVAYLSGLCNLAFTATQYALLASLGNFARVQMAAFSGVMVDAMDGDWAGFFLMTIAIAVPGLILLGVMMKKFPPED